MLEVKPTDFRSKSKTTQVKRERERSECFMFIFYLKRARLRPKALYSHISENPSFLFEPLK